MSKCVFSIDAEFVVARWQARAEQAEQCAMFYEDSLKTMTALLRERANVYRECAVELERHITGEPTPKSTESTRASVRRFPKNK